MSECNATCEAVEELDGGFDGCPVCGRPAEAHVSEKDLDALEIVADALTTPARDTFTSTVEGAAAYERLHPGKF